MKKILLTFSAIAGAIFLFLFLTAQSTRNQKAPGLSETGTLVACPDRPSCVSSEEGDVEPFIFPGTVGNAWNSLQFSIEHLGGSVDKKEGAYLAATFRSKYFGFVDDVEFRMLPDEKSIHVRSGSRIGYYDLGANRKRVEALRKLFQQLQQDEF